MTRLLTALLVALSLCVSARADDAPRQAHPALWKVAGRHCTVYLLGSVHALPPDLQWRDARVQQAIDGADAYFFETALDAAAMTNYVVNRGILPPGQSLRAMLPPESQKDLDEDLASIGAGVGTVDTSRPWLATLIMTSVKVKSDGAAPSDGVDVKIMADAKGRGKPLRYFETTDQQMAMLAPDDPKIELSQFETFLKEFRDDPDDLGPLVDAWANGDQAALARLLFHEFDKTPGMRKLFFDDRNRRWARVLTRVLDREDGTFLVTVGAGHMLSERGLPALLQRAGFKVERI